jgi:hypothetical protein
VVLLDRKELVFQEPDFIIKSGTGVFAEFRGELGIKLRFHRKVTILLGLIILYVLLEFAVELFELLSRKIEAEQLEL